MALVCLFLKPGSHCVSLTEILLLLPTECLGLKACTTAAWPVLGFLHIPRGECFLCFKGSSVTRQALASHSAGITVLCHQAWLFCFCFCLFFKAIILDPRKVVALYSVRVQCRALESALLCASSAWVQALFILFLAWFAVLPRGIHASTGLQTNLGQEPLHYPDVKWEY